MDRARAREIVDRTAVQAAGGEPIELLLRTAGHRERREPGVDEGDRPFVSEAAVLRSPAHDRLAARVGLGRQSQTGCTIDACDGTAGDASWAAHQPSSSRAPNLPVSAEGAYDRTAQPGVVCRYHLRTDDGGISVPGSGHGLVQSLRAFLGAVQSVGSGVLRGSVGAGAGTFSTPTRVRSLPPSSLQALWSRPASRSAWMGEAARWTM